MASSCITFQVSCCAQKRPSISHDFNHFKTKLSSLFKELPMQIDVPKFIKNGSVKLLDAFVDSTFKFVDEPRNLSQSNFAPVDEVGEPVVISSIEGKIPDDFPMGVYIRNGPPSYTVLQYDINTYGANPLFGGLKSTKSVFGMSSRAWVEGEGMLHAMYFDKDSDGNWTVVYNNKYVETDTFILEKQRNKPSFLPAAEGDSLAVLAGILLNLLRFGKTNKTQSNTAVIEHAGKLYALGENHLPHEFDIFSLATLGNWNVNGGWTRPFTSHPKKVPSTGELVTMGFDVTKPYAVVGVISADGEKLIHKLDLELNRCPFSHDIGVTERFTVFLDLPLIIDINRLIRGGSIIKYNKEEYAKIGVCPRYGDVNSIQWFDVEPCCMFHLLNCFEDGDEVVVRGCRALDAIIPGPDGGLNKFEWFSKRFILNEKVSDDFTTEDGSLFARVYEWRLNIRTGNVKERYLTGRKYALDFPIINADFTGVENKYGYAQVVDSIASAIAAIPKYKGVAKLYFEDKDSEYPKREGQTEGPIKVEYNFFEENTYGTGIAFVPKQQGLDEDDGWLVTYVHNEDTNISQVYIIDTRKFSDEPVTKITLPCRVPHGFHAAFVSMTKSHP